MTRKDLAHVARAVLMNRRDRELALPDTLFTDHAWEALLHLFIADVREQAIPLDRLATLVRCSPRTMRRWTELLAGEGLAAIDADDHVTLLPPARIAVADYLRQTGATTEHLVERSRRLLPRVI